MLKGDTIISRRGSVAPQADSSIRQCLYVHVCTCMLWNVSRAISQKWLNAFLTHFADWLFYTQKYTLALCQNRVLMSIFVITVVHFCYISHMNIWMLFIFCIVTIYHESLMHFRSKFTLCQHGVHWAISAVLTSLLLEIPLTSRHVENMLFLKFVYNKHNLTFFPSLK